MGVLAVNVDGNSFIMPSDMNAVAPNALKDGFPPVSLSDTIGTPKRPISSPVEHPLKYVSGIKCRIPATARRRRDNSLRMSQTGKPSSAVVGCSCSGDSGSCNLRNGGGDSTEARDAREVTCSCCCCRFVKVGISCAATAGCKCKRFVCTCRPSAVVNRARQ